MATTALAAVDLQPNPEQRGVNLMDLSAVNARDAIYCDVYEHDMANLEHPAETMVANFVVQEGWKLLVYPDHSNELFQLYDATTGAPVDPFEVNDLSNTESAKVAELSNLIDTWYNEPKDLDWGAQASQIEGTESIEIPENLGQSFTVEASSYLAGIKIPFQQINTNQTPTLELRDLDEVGAATGALIDRVTVVPEAVYTNGLRWCLFPFEQLIPVSAGQKLGFQIKTSDQPNTGYRIAYNSAEGYSGGKMVYSGLVGSNTWDQADYDLSFQALHGNYALSRDAKITVFDQEVHASVDMGFKGQPVSVQSCTNLSDGWVDLGDDENLDGLVATTGSLQSQEFYRFALSLTGAAFTLTTNYPPITGVLYEELFDGSGVSIDGEIPNTTATTASTTWSGPSGDVLMDNGDALTSGSGTAYLPFTPEDGFTYTLEVTIEQAGTPDADEWVACGFLKANPNPAADPSGGTGLIWALTRNKSGDENQVLHEKVTGGVGSVERGNYVEGSGTVAMKFVLDTTQGSGNWTYDWIVNEVEQVSNRALSTSFESAIGSVGIAKRATSTAHTFSSFKLTSE